MLKYNETFRRVITVLLGDMVARLHGMTVADTTTFIRLQTEYKVCTQQINLLIAQLSEDDDAERARAFWDARLKASHDVVAIENLQEGG